MNGFIRLAMLYVFGFLFAESLLAFPENPVFFTVDNAGDSLTIRNVGDEHYRYTETFDGYLVIRGEDGVYRYATEEGVAGNVKAKNADRRRVEEKNYLEGIRREKVQNAHFEKNPDRLFVPFGEKFEKKAPWVPALDTPSADFPVLKLPAASGHVKGTNRFPVLLVAGADASNCDSSLFYAQVNQSGYSRNGHIGSVKDYFRDQSNGLFIPSFDIYLVKVNNTLASYAKREGRLVKEAVDNLLSKYPDFDASKYDADGDGEVDAVAVMYAGTKTSANNLGGFAYMLKYNNSTNDYVGMLNAGNGKKFNRYFILQQMNSETNSETALTPIAQFVHEFSHTMGLKDHYCVYGGDCYKDFKDSVYQAPGVHSWDVMGTGMYNGPVQGATPVGYSAFEKAFMGWISYRTLEEAWKVTVLPPFITTDVAYKISVPGNNDEWFILENRQKMGWDANLPYHGMLIWHIDYDSSAWWMDSLNDNPSHQRIDVVEAGDLKVDSYSAGFFHDISREYLNDDPYPGTQGIKEFSAVSWTGANLGVNLYQITERGGNICFASGSDIPVGDCIASSSSAGSSSSSMESSSSEKGSSSSMEGFSSSEETAIVLAQPVKTSIDLYGTTLAVSSNVFGKKLVRLYDLSGREVFHRRFDGAMTTFDVKKYSGKMLVVRLSEGGRLLMHRQIAVR